jgi:hypothetical protein
VAVSRSSGKPAASSATGSTGGCTGRPPRPRQAGWPPSGRCCTARTGRGAAEIARHRLPVPGSPQIYDEHYPHHPGGNGPRQPRPRPPTEAEAAFLAIGDGAQRSLAEAAASGAVRIGSKMARAAELAAVVGADKVDAALGLAAIAGRFADGDLPSIIDHLATQREIGEVVIANEAHFAQPGTAGWARLGTQAGR